MRKYEDVPNEEFVQAFYAAMAELGLTAEQATAADLYEMVPIIARILDLPPIPAKKLQPDKKLLAILDASLRRG